MRKPFNGKTRKSITRDTQDWVRDRPLFSDKSIPRIVEPNINGVDLISWASAHSDFVEQLLLQHRALLFRGFDVNSIDTFNDFVKATSDNQLLSYKDRTTPRSQEGNGIYTSTIHPAAASINLHNEGTYWQRWPLKLYFYCEIAPPVRGETPIADTRKVYENIPEEIRQKFIHKKIALVRNFNSGFGLGWQEVFQTDNRDEVTEYCRENDIHCEWGQEDRLRTKQVREAVRIHPQTGEPTWFNHCAFFHWSTLEEPNRSLLIEEYGLDGIPYNVTYGDGSTIDETTVAVLREAYLAEKVMFRWQNKDVMLLDNMSVAHAREPYEGDRRILVAMTNPHDGVVDGNEMSNVAEGGGA